MPEELGGRGADRFVFDDLNTGADVIRDFSDGQDRIDLGDNALISTLAQGDDVLLTHDGGSILIEDVTPAQITAADFI